MYIGDLIQIVFELDPKYESDTYLIIDIDHDYKFEEDICNLSAQEVLDYPPVTCYKLIGQNGLMYFCMADPVTKFKLVSPALARSQQNI